MSIRVFRKSKWRDLEQGYLLFSDCVGLDPVLDRLLIERVAGKLVRRIRDDNSERWMSVFLRKYGFSKAPEERDDRLVLREQVVRENDKEVLKEAAFRNRKHDVGRFAFCRLTGYNLDFPESDGSDRDDNPYSCGLKSDMIREDIEEFCREMIEKEGPFAEEARQWLARLPEIDDDTLDRWAEGRTERVVHEDAYKGLRERMRPSDGASEHSDEELADLMRTLFDVYIIMVLEERIGPLPRSKKYRITDPFFRYALMIMSTQVGRDYLMDGMHAVYILMNIGHVLRDDITAERIGEVIRTESGTNPRHSFFLGVAYQYGIDTPADEEMARKMYANAAAGGFTHRL
jgi:hypothetical protein